MENENQMDEWFPFCRFIFCKSKKMSKKNEVMANIYISTEVSKPHFNLPGQMSNIH